MSLLASTLLAVGKAAAPIGPQVGQHAAAAPSLFGAVLALLAVLALVIGLGWLLKRMPGSGFRPAEGMKLVASLSVGARNAWWWWRSMASNCCWASPPAASTPCIP